ncbi:MAG: TIGR00282 family metallophosphoesterase [Clostridia bacterium]|nr:TIGR00282 family metallophosphoesterase [Clostridia bacterium]
MRILCIGDIVGECGRQALRRELPKLKANKNIDLVIANGENSGDHNGITPNSAEHIFTSGVDVITTGNHVFRRREIFDTLEQNEFIVRPANYPENAPGKGMQIIDMGRSQVAVINLMGVVYMEPLQNPFDTVDALIDKARDMGAKIVIVDFHAEATSEKRAMGYYLDGRVSAVFGTHTHVQTNDLQILPEGTGYITDLGMSGPSDSVLGVKTNLAISKLKDKLPVKFENAEGKAIISGCIFDIDDKTAKTIDTEIVSIIC